MRWNVELATACGALAMAAVCAAAAVRGTQPEQRLRAPEASAVQAVLDRHCTSCHGGAAPSGGLDLRTLTGVLTGGNSGPAVARGSAVRSLLYKRLAEGSMPPAGQPRLAATELATIRSWIDSLNYGSTTQHPKPNTEHRTPNTEHRTPNTNSHWSLRPPVLPPIPAVQNRWWVRTPIDAFVLSRLEAAGLPAPRIADRRTLLRRVYLDVIGLPPAPDEQQRFLADRSPDAWERVVDDLLARPQYGERWARHWLDVARYAESNGYERDGTKPSAWRYRDWVIDSLNADKPYDQFLTEQLAGDEMPGTNAERQIATTFLRLGTWDDEPADRVVDRYDQLDDVLGTVSAAFMAQTIRCARCHDHKFEPFTQRDYYRLLACFEPLKRSTDGAHDPDRLVGTPEEVSAYEKATADIDARVAEARRQRDGLDLGVRDRLFSTGASKLDAKTTAAFRVAPEKRNEVERELVRKAGDTLDKEIESALMPDERSRRASLDARIAALEASRPKELPRGYIWYEDGPTVPPTCILKRGDPKQRGAEVQPGVPAVLAPEALAAPAPLARSTGRRLWLARWLTRPDNPLTARVIVNRVWEHHFGEGIVSTENDFGVMGSRPTNQALLDWLASEFIAHGEGGSSHETGNTRSGHEPPLTAAGDASAMRPLKSGGGTRVALPAVTPVREDYACCWSLKKLHRLILLSNAYKMASVQPTSASGAGRRHSEDVPLESWPQRRAEAEVVRDSMLAVSGRLNLEMHGPSVYPALPRAVLEGQSVPGQNWGKSDEREASRRSIYIFVKRSLAVPELEVLDAPDTTSSCERRPVSTVAPQALTFLNGEFARQQSDAFATRLEREAGQNTAVQVRRAYELALCRPATTAEIAETVAFLEAQRRQNEDDAAAGATRLTVTPAHRALAAFCLLLFNTSEFVYTR